MLSDQYPVDIRLLEQLAAASVAAGSAGAQRFEVLAFWDKLPRFASSLLSAVLLFDSCLQGYKDRFQGSSSFLILPRRDLTRRIDRVQGCELSASTRNTRTRT
jgi:hypothetical protein